MQQGTMAIGVLWVYLLVDCCLKCDNADAGSNILEWVELLHDKSWFGCIECRWIV